MSHTIERGDPLCATHQIHENWVAYQDMEPPKSSSILRKSSDTRKPIRRVKFTRAVARHADIGDQNASLGLIFPGEPHQRSPNAPKFEDSGIRFEGEPRLCVCPGVGPFLVHFGSILIII